jgi:hypothetical protein
MHLILHERLFALPGENMPVMPKNIRPKPLLIYEEGRLPVRGRGL